MPTLLTVCLLAVLAFCPTAVAGGDQVHDAMETMNRHYRVLKMAFRNAPDPDQIETYREAARGLEQQTRLALEAAPHFPERFSEAEQATLTRGYAEAMKAMHREVTALVNALDKNDLTSAEAALKTIGKMKKQGHEKYQFEDEESSDDDSSSHDDADHASHDDN